MREYLLTAVVSAAVTYLLTPVARRIALRWGAMTQVRDRDVHAIPTPRLGGVAMMGGFTAALVVANNLPFLGPRLEMSDLLAVMSGAVLICLLGVADDRWELDAVTKLAGQVLAAGVMVLQGVQMLFLPFGGLAGESADGVPGAVVLGPPEGAVLTVLVIVVTINAVNFVDGLDGLAAGIVAIAASAFFAFSYLLAVQEGLLRATTAGVVAAALIGCCVGFLPHNFSPARVFMGDSGSMLIGLLLATTTITLTGSVNPNDVGTDIAPALVPLLLPLAVMVVPFLDLLLAVVRRTAAGRSPFAPDKQHLHHRLLERGHSHARAVLVMYLWSAVLAYGAVAIAFLDTRTLVLSLIAVSVVALLLTVNIPRLRRAEGTFTGLRRGRVR
ncbi:MAG TPA: MraY family glycosyltransferase [Actinomycetes bacterium]|nr:MraY family glycosyltransferase [Actinomycetes bacterium]